MIKKAKFRVRQFSENKINAVLLSAFCLQLLEERFDSLVNEPLISLKVDLSIT